MNILIITTITIFLLYTNKFKQDFNETDLGNTYGAIVVIALIYALFSAVL